MSQAKSHQEGADPEGVDLAEEGMPLKLEIVDWCQGLGLSLLLGTQQGSFASSNGREERQEGAEVNLTSCTRHGGKVLLEVLSAVFSVHL